jgi:two-component system response regulator
MSDSENYVLMVEDNADDVTLTLRSFEKNKFPCKVVVMRDGAQALKHLFGDDPSASPKRSARPALILLDLNLPKVHGFEVLKQLREDAVFKDVPVIILSSSNEERDRAQAQRLGANLYIRKPINFNDFNVVADQIAEFLATTLKSMPA